MKEISQKKPFARYCQNCRRLSNKMINRIEDFTLTFRREKKRGLKMFCCSANQVKQVVSDRNLQSE